jgi:hypothetical protein
MNVYAVKCELGDTPYATAHMDIGTGHLLYWEEKVIYSPVGYPKLIVSPQRIYLEVAVPLDGVGSMYERALQSL